MLPFWRFYCFGINGSCVRIYQTSRHRRRLRLSRLLLRRSRPSHSRRSFGTLASSRPSQMRRSDREVFDQKVISEILTTAGVCRLAMVDNGEPYLVPLNYGYCDNALYIHSAAAGRKIGILKRHPAVCFEIESASVIVKHAKPCHWGTKSRSLIGYGRVEFITDDQQKRRGLDIIMAHHGKTGPSLYDEKQLRAVLVLKISIERITCKQLGDWS